MPVSTISGSVANLITLGSGGYADQLTITSTGTVSTPIFYAAGPTIYAQVVLDGTGSTLLNAGQILAGLQSDGIGFDFGAIGLSLASGQVFNSGTILGGRGLSSFASTGAVVSGGSLYNSGLISGGYIFDGGDHIGPGRSSLATEVGVYLTGGTVTNAGIVTGGSVAAAGLDMSGGVFVNDATITGGVYTFKSYFYTYVNRVHVRTYTSYFYGGPGARISQGVLINDGVIRAPASPGTGIAGTLEATAPGLKISGGTVINNGTITAPTIHRNPVVSMTGGTMLNAGELDGFVLLNGTASGTDFTNTGTVTRYILGTAADITNGGLIEDGIGFYRGSAGLTLEVGSRINGAVDAVGSYNIVVYGTGPGPHLPTIVTIQELTDLDLAAGSVAGSLDMGGSFSGWNTIEFDPGATWVLGGTAAELAAGQTITGFDLGDTLVLEGFTANSSTIAGGELTLTNATQSLTLDLSGSFSGLIVTDVAQGTEIAVCYLRGTPILTPEGERAIEDLRAGDAVVTKFGGVRRIKWIGVQSFAGRFLEGNAEMLPVRIKADALGQGAPARDLFVSPGHSLLLNGQLILAKLLVNGVTVTQEEPPAQVDYFNIELDTHDCVLAAGIWAESYAECAVTRGMFHNAADFTKDFPGHIAPETPRLCAPRPMAGAALASAIGPAVARAAASARPGALRGYIDILSAGGRAEGWAQDMANPDLPVMLDVLRDGVRVAQLLACEMRPDLRDAGIGSGKHAFAATIPGSGKIEIIRAADGAKLALTEAALRAA